MKTGNILVIDDDAEIREIVQVLLSSEGYTVETVADGMQALTMLTEKTFIPDVIILDIMMPDMDGYSVCKQIREISQVPDSEEQRDRSGGGLSGRRRRLYAEAVFLHRADRQSGRSDAQIQTIWRAVRSSEGKAGLYQRSRHRQGSGFRDEKR